MLLEKTDQNEKNLLVIQRDLGIALGNVSELQTALNICLDAVLRIVEVDCAGIYLVDSDNGDLYLAEFRNLPTWFVKLGSYYDKDSLHARLVMNTKPIFSSYNKILYSLDLEKKDIIEKQKSGMKGFGLIPLIHENKVIGVLNIASKEFEYFQDFTKYALEAIAFQVAGILTKIQAIEALKQSQNNLKTLFENLNDFLFVLDETGKIVEFNPVVKKRLGYSENELLRMSAFDLHHIDRREEAAQIISDMLKGKQTNCKIPLLTKDGEKIPVETVVTPGVWNHKNAIFGISRDISRRIQMEKARQLSEDRLAAAIDALDEGFVMYDNEDRLTMVNLKALELYEESAEKIFIGNKFEDILWYGLKHGQYPDAIGRENEWAKIRIEQHKLANSSYEQRLKGGHWLKITERKTRGGDTVGFRVDITDFKKAEEINRKALKEKETLLREIHHRVKNNMQVISSLLNLQAHRSNDLNTLKALKHAESRIHSMTLVHEILYQSEDLTNINLEFYLEKLIQHIENLFAQNNTPIITVNAKNIILRMDHIISCGLIITELVSNSLKYGFSDNFYGTIKVEFNLSDKYRLYVSDNGKGLPENFNWESSRTLGLRLVRELVEGQLEGTLTLLEQKKGVSWKIAWR